MTRAPRIAVVGGGLTGLTTVRELLHRGHDAAEIRLFESDDRVGGLVRSETHEGFVLDLGPDSIYTDKAEGVDLALELGLADAMVPQARLPVLIFWRGTLHPMPPLLSPPSSAEDAGILSNRLLSLFGRLRAALEPIVPARRRRSDESIASFIRRRFGRQALERVGDPLLAGIHAGDPTMLSIQHAFPRLVELERRHGSVRRGVRERAESGTSAEGSSLPKHCRGARFVGFREGMQQLVDALVAEIEGHDPEILCTATPVQGLRPVDGDGGEWAAPGFDLDLGGETWRTDVCVLAVPGKAAADLVEPFDSELSLELGAIPHASTLAVYLAYPPGAVDLPEASGCLIPHSQGHPVFAVSLLHNKFEGRVPEGAALVRAFMGGMRKPELVRGDDRTLVRIAREELAMLFGVEAEPAFTRIQRWPRANPQYVVGHGERVAAIDGALRSHPGLMISGSCCRGVGIPDTIASGRRTAAAIARWLGER